MSHSSHHVWELATPSHDGPKPQRTHLQGTLHRISALRNRKGTVVGLTCRVGRAVTGHIEMIADMIEGTHAHSVQR